MPSAISCERLALLRGRVIDLAGSPVGGVRVTVRHHPELGSGFTRADGLFDLAVNGESGLVLDFRKSAFLGASRRLDVSWGEQISLDDVALVPQASGLPTITLGAGAQASIGPIVTDGSGNRRARLFFPAGETATMQLPNGSSQALSSLTLRITERSSGPRGAAAMALDLPTSMGYTYAVHLETDEGSAAGATRVDFASPLALHLENFTGFPVGLVIPTGFLDDSLQRWVPAANGKVLRVVSIGGGLAELDFDGSGSPASSTALAGLGITTEERQQIALEFVAGQSFWRVPIAHFSDWAMVMPWAPEHPNLAPGLAEPTSGDDQKVDKPRIAAFGGLIEVENQILGQSLGITGTPLALTYRSDRVPGRTAPFVLTIPASGPSIDSGLIRIEVVIDVAGQRVVQTLPPAPSQTVTYSWDGLDRFHRPVQGVERWRVEVRHIYPSVYFSPAPFVPSFLHPGVAVLVDIPGRAESALRSISAGFVGAMQALGSEALGGWTLNAHHQFDPKTQTLYYGSGGRRVLGGAGHEPEVLYRVAGTGTAGSSGDGGQAREGELSAPVGLSVNGKGELLITEQGSCRIRKVDRNGVLSTIAGGECIAPTPGGTVGDGGPAVGASIYRPKKAIEGPDGSIYIADAGNSRVRRIDPDGDIETILGTGVAGCSSNGDAAGTRQLVNPFDVALDASGDLIVVDRSSGFAAQCRAIMKVTADGRVRDIVKGSQAFPSSCQPPACTPFGLVNPTGLASAPDGTIYFTQDHSIRFISPHEGAMEDEPDWNLAGLGFAFNFGYAGDGEPASDFNTYFDSPFHIARASNGTLYIADSGNHAIRRIDPAKIVDTFAGSGFNATPTDGSPARQVRFGAVTGVALDPSGETLYFSDFDHNIVWRMALPTPFFDGEYRIPSEDGALLFVFDPTGRHLRTEDTVHDRVVLTFGYTSYSAGGSAVEWLTSVTDAYANTTTIERSSSGAPLAIVAPFGQRTELEINPTTGYLSKVSHGLEVGEERVILTHAANGLLQSLKDPKDHITNYQYDAEGRLTRVLDAAGGSRELDLQSLLRGHRIVSTSEMGRQSQTTVEFLPRSEVRQLSRNASGFETETVREASGRSTTTAPDNTEIVTEESPDPRFGPLARYGSKSTLTTPEDHLELSATRSMTVDVSPLDPLELAQWESATTINGRTAQTSYLQSDRLAVSTSPEGRKSSTLFDDQGRVSRQWIAGVEPTRVEYDAKGRVQKVAQGSPSTERRVTYTYDEETGYLDEIKDVLDEVTSFEYDEVGRVTKQILPDLREVHFAYDLNGNLSSISPPTRPAHHFDHDDVDQLASYAPPDLAPETLEVPQTSFAYNADHQLTGITRPDGQQSLFTYDSGGRLDFVTLPTGTLNLSFDSENGKLASLTAPGGSTIAFDFDGPALRSVATTGANPATVELFYDRPYPGLLKTNFWLESTRINALEASRVRYERDDDGLVTKAGDETILRRPDNGFVTGTSLLDSHDVVARSTKGEFQTYTGGVKPPAATCVFTTPSYGCVALFKEEVLERDRYGRIVKRRETTRDTFASNPTLHLYEYVYDPDRAWLKEVKRDGTTVATYAYDANGNRTSWTDGWGSGSATYDAQDRMLTRGAATYAYTANGELLSKTEGAYSQSTTYDVLGNLLHVTLPDGVAIDYDIDAQNRRIGKKV
ncbi:MAG: hypothetical protein ABIU84_10055, partial [Thermoanaerobaculia bacterium]